MSAEELSSIASELSKLAYRLATLVNGEQPPQDRLKQFFDEGHAYVVKGSSVSLTQFYSVFRLFLPEHERSNWNKAKLKSVLPYPTFNEGRSDQPTVMVDGISFKPAPVPEVPKVNPDYDRTAIYWIAQPMRKQGILYDIIADHLNELGHRDKHGELFTWDSAKDASWD